MWNPSVHWLLYTRWPNYLGYSRIRGGNFRPKPGRGWRFSRRSCRCFLDMGLAYLNQGQFSQMFGFLHSEIAYFPCSPSSWQSQRALVCAGHCPGHRDTIVSKSAPDHAWRSLGSSGGTGWKRLTPDPPNPLCFPGAEPVRVWPWCPSGGEVSPPQCPQMPTWPWGGSKPEWGFCSDRSYSFNFPCQQADSCDLWG